MTLEKNTQANNPTKVYIHPNNMKWVQSSHALHTHQNEIKHEQK